uniref:Uncharacterized protein n=1 Tax=Chromera velia CCMP2878 TaxID=1169474 RepID=A0A0G4HI20_9ALVE|eukprot:Cvel_27687.t1-p1 / transcript=Cvel_27687.t1 / gene=Cvel_27687 / organism=Chromera_velia_CCMP2878 / gene_product=hypothetical protein / transcript_product=hypothetical protein / location=Cvel_scaffold3494:9179-9697(+) / protein_length=173 / sequence_SO=supercontig / SO=protein_coding / is_pseudo=false
MEQKEVEMEPACAQPPLKRQRPSDETMPQKGPSTRPKRGPGRPKGSGRGRQPASVQPVPNPLQAPLREQPCRLYGQVCADLPVPQESDYPKIAKMADELYASLVRHLDSRNETTSEDYIRALVSRNLRQWGVRKDTIPLNAEVRELLLCVLHLRGDDQSLYQNGPGSQTPAKT